MIRRLAVVLGLGLLFGASAGRATDDPLAEPVKDCRPCRLTPGTAQPVLDLTFVFQGDGDAKVLTAIEVTPEGGGKTQRLETGDIAVSDFPDGFILDHPDLNFDGLGDLALTTQQAADNDDVKYWLYRPASHDYAPLERVGDDDADYALSPGPDHELVSHVRDGAVASTDYWYRVTGTRAVAVRKEVMGAEGALMQDATYDLTVKPAKLVKRVTVGFSGDSPERTKFLAQLEAASTHADALYRSGNKAGAVAALEPLLKDMQLALLTETYPAGNDAGDRKIVGEVNNYGFYLAEAGRAKEAVEVLSSVTDAAPDRTVAYLNLADAQFAAGAAADAKTNYAEYAKRMTAAGNAAHIPPRVAERAR